MYVELQVENKRSNVKRLLIRSQAMIGRQAHCDIRVVSNEISREHCRIEIQPQGAVLIDLGSTNGTFVNRKRVEPHGEILLNEQDVILVGPAAFTVHLVVTRDHEETFTAGEETLAPGDRSQALAGSPANGTLQSPGLSRVPVDSQPPAAIEETIAADSRDADDSADDIAVDDDLKDLANDDDDLEGGSLLGVTSDNDMEAISDDDAFDRFLKNM